MHPKRGVDAARPSALNSGRETSPSLWMPGETTKMSCSLLINEPPLMVLPGLAKKIGLNEAIILQQIHYWVRTQRHVIDGHSWTYNSIPEWQEQFPFWSEVTIRRGLKSLEEQGLIIRRQLSTNRFDATHWYAIDMEVLSNIDDRVDAIKMIARSDQNDRVRSDQIEHITSTKNTETASKTNNRLTASDLVDEGISTDLADEFLALRKAKKAPLTKRAWSGINREAVKAGWSLEAVLQKCLERGWQSFEAEWVAPRRSLQAEPEKKDNRFKGLR